jgi:predicted transcriptional regulator
MHPLLTRIVSDCVKKHRIIPADIPALVNAVYHSLIGPGEAPKPPLAQSAVPIRLSVRTNYVVCVECGWRGHMLRQHLQAKHGLTPEQYRAKWRLSPDHPLTAPAYSQRRSEIAKQLGFGKGATGRRRRRPST